MQPDLPVLATIDGQKLNIGAQADAIRLSIARLCAGEGFTLFTLNLDHLVKRRSAPAFRSAYDNATFVTADGAPIVALARRQGAHIARATGADLVEPLCAAAARHGLPVCFYGSRQDILDAAARRLAAAHPGLAVAASMAPPQGFDPASAQALADMAALAGSGARLCFVALGAPKQELFAARMAALHPGIGFVCIGAALDFVAGAQKRAPAFFQRTGMEWAWRLACEPRRLAMRYLGCALLLADVALLDPLRALFSPARKVRG